MGFFDAIMNNKKNESKELLTIAILMYSSTLDGETSQQELAFIKNKVDLLSNEGKEKVKEIINDFDANIFIEEAKSLNDEEKGTLIYDCLELAKSDGKISIEEVRFILGLSSVFNFDIDNILKLMVKHFNYDMTELENAMESDENVTAVKNEVDNTIGFKKNRDHKVTDKSTISNNSTENYNIGFKKKRDSVNPIEDKLVAKFCTSCGTPTSNGKFCVNCGTSII